MPLNNCNEAQLRAVKHFKGPLLLSAGPGSGKTFTIVERIRYLIEEYKVEPSEILVITFTKAAAAEMEQRFSKAVKEKNYPVNFGTFHAVFFHILKQAYQYHSNNIITEKEKREYLKYALEGLKKEDTESLTEQLKEAIALGIDEGDIFIKESHVRAFLDVCLLLHEKLYCAKVCIVAF